MIFIWRGRGIMALFALVLPLGSCVGLIDARVDLALLSSGLTLLLGGLVCRHFGNKWNRHGTQHSMYFIPLQIWGWIYIVYGAVLTAGGCAGVIRTMRGR